MMIWLRSQTIFTTQSRAHTSFCMAKETIACVNRKFQLWIKWRIQINFVFNKTARKKNEYEQTASFVFFMPEIKSNQIVYNGIEHGIFSIVRSLCVSLYIISCIQVDPLSYGFWLLNPKKLIIQIESTNKWTHARSDVCRLRDGKKEQEREKKTRPRFSIDQHVAFV